MILRLDLDSSSVDDESLLLDRAKDVRQHLLDPHLDLAGGRRRRVVDESSAENWLKFAALLRSLDPFQYCLHSALWSKLGGSGRLSK